MITCNRETIQKKKDKKQIISQIIGILETHDIEYWEYSTSAELSEPMEYVHGYPTFEASGLLNININATLTKRKRRQSL